MVPRLGPTGPGFGIQWIIIEKLDKQRLPDAAQPRTGAAATARPCTGAAADAPPCKRIRRPRSSTHGCRHRLHPSSASNADASEPLSTLYSTPTEESLRRRRFRTADLVNGRHTACRSWTLTDVEEQVA